MADVSPSQPDQAKVAQQLFVKAAASDRADAGSGSACKGASKIKPMLTQGCPWVGADEPSEQSAGGCPVMGASPATGGCPVVGASGGGNGALDPNNQMPHSANAPQAGQATKLHTGRQASSIPIGASEQAPPHQEPSTHVWQYPSEQMFFNAMKRKGWDAKEEDMHSVVAIHNSVNERAWQQVCQYEALHTGCTPKLKRFAGRPQDYSPKARLLNLLGYKLPFDRHDWIVDRCGREVRYVIDFYNAAPLPGMPIAMHLDTRPALDSPGALLDRLRMQAKWVASRRWARE